MVTVGEIMHGATRVKHDASVHDVAKLMESKNIGSVLVERDGDVHGILTERDMVTRVVAAAGDPKKTKAGDVMTALQYTIEHSQGLLEASEMFRKHHIRRLPVMREGKIVGIVTTRDVAKAMPYALYSLMSARRRRDEEYPLDL